jgi:hypothetical protein
MLSPNIKDLSEQFSRKERYGSGMITQNDFIAEIQRIEGNLSS